MNDPATDVRSLCDALESLLDGPGRREIVDRVSRGGRLPEALQRLRTSMSKHGFEGLPADFARIVHRLDQRTRKDGFRVLHSWNHTTHRFTDELTPVLMIDFFERAAADDAAVRVSVAILLDYYLLHLLALAVVRAWDTDDPGAALDRIGRLLDLLQGPDGSGHRFVSDAEMLLILALSQFHPEEQAYDRIIEKTSALPRTNEVAFARASAAVLGAHLRWGFWVMYQRDIQRMRDDNVGDYPWLLYSVTTLLRAWADMAGDPARSAERSEIAGSLMLGLAADPWALTGPPPTSLEPFAEMHAECRTLLETHGPRLLEGLEEHRPTRESFAPLAFLFNFPHNALVAAVTVALLEGRPRALALDDFFDPTDGAPSGGDEAKEEFARALMAFSAGSPERLGYRGAMLVGYDPFTALRSYSMTLKVLRESLV